jgi:hypothetical protein
VQVKCCDSRHSVRLCLRLGAISHALTPGILLKCSKAPRNPTHTLCPSLRPAAAMLFLYYYALGIRMVRELR